MAATCTVTAAILTPFNANGEFVVTFKLVAPRNSTSDDKLVSVNEVTATSTAGALSVTLIRTDQFDFPNAYYEVTCAELGFQKKRMTLTGSSFNLADL